MGNQQDLREQCFQLFEESSAKAGDGVTQVCIKSYSVEDSQRLTRVGMRTVLAIHIEQG